MRGYAAIVLAATGLILAATVQASDSGARQIDKARPIDEPTQAEVQEPALGEVLLDDAFTANWGTGTDQNSSIQYSDNALRFIVYTKNWFVWSTPDDQSYENIRMEVTVRNNGADANTAMGLLCGKQGETSSFYYFAITPAGQYAISRAEQGKSDVFLTADNKWGTSDRIASNAAFYRLGADCGSELVLYVDGNEIARASDAAYGSGGVGLMIWSAENATKTDVSFDDFVMTELQ